jgi:hypothetical protein
VALIAKKEKFFTMNIRRVAEQLYYKIKMGAAIEHKTTKDFVLDTLKEKLQELERLGKLPKEK